MSLTRVFFDAAHSKSKAKRINDMTKEFRESEHEDANIAAINYFFSTMSDQQIDDMVKDNTDKQMSDLIEANVPMKQKSNGEFYYTVKTKG